MKFQGEHANHKLTWNLEAIQVFPITGIRQGDFGLEIICGPQSDTTAEGEDFFWCEDCSEYVYPSDFAGDDTGQWQIV